MKVPSPASRQPESILPLTLALNSMTDYLPPNLTHIAGIVSDLADDLDRARSSGGLRKILTSGKITRGEAYMDRSRILAEHCGPLMNKVDRAKFRKDYDAATNAREKLDASDVSRFQRFRDAGDFKNLSKKAYRGGKRASDRALDKNFRERYDRQDPPAGASHTTTPEASDGEEPPAGAPPASTPEESKRLQPHDHFTDSPAATTSNIGEQMQDPKITTLSTGAAGEPMDEVPDTYSFIYDPSLASSVASIASYKTEKSVNSRKSRYNAHSRRKYSDSGYLSVPQGRAPSHVDDGSITETESGDEYFEASSGSLRARPNSPKPELVTESRPGPSPGTQPHDGLRAALPATEHVQPLGCAHPTLNSHAIPPSGPFPDQLMTGGAQEVETATIISELADSDIYGTESEAGVND